MLYAPHTLYIKSADTLQVDSLGRPVVSQGDWVKIGPCRCDDDSTQELKSENGQYYKSRFHVVFDKNMQVNEGDEVKCLNADGTVRGGGFVGMVKSTNYLSYSELWT